MASDTKERALKVPKERALKVGINYYKKRASREETPSFI